MSVSKNVFTKAKAARSPSAKTRVGGRQQAKAAKAAMIARALKLKEAPHG